MSARTYIFRFFFFGALAIVAVLAFNFSVDPYAITGVERVPGFSQYKVEINNYIRLTKKYQPEYRQYNALIIGNSRVEMGINPSHHCFKSDGWKVYNLGMPGAGVRTQLEYALNVMYQQPIENILLSVDFTDFLSSSPLHDRRSTAMTDQSAGQLRYLPSGEHNPGFFQVMLVDYYKSLFSLNSLVSSFKTVAMQSDLASDRDETGFNPARDFSEAVRLEGAGALFEQKMHDLDKKYSKNWYLDQSFEDISEFLAIAAKQGVTVYLFTNPFHESYWELMQEHGLASKYTDWARSIEVLAKAHGNRAVTVWDFSLESPYIHEQVPDQGVRSGPLKWFWEPAHYRKELGDLMVDAMLSESCNSPVVFGRRIR